MRGPGRNCLPLLLAWLLQAAAGDAAGLDLKSLILMPGPLTAAHAEQEQHCEACHSSFDKSGQDPLCLDCHEEIAADRDRGEGFHGRSGAATGTPCKSCHTDHKGRDYDIVALDRDVFDHRDTDFGLSGAHTAVPCASCHKAGTAFRDTPGTCQACHREQDHHRGALGEDCAACHTPRGWAEVADFNHDDTHFPLQGAHRELACVACHAGETYAFANTGCNTCHQLRDVHLGRYGDNCERCHGQDDWALAVFDHQAETDFPLTGAHRDTACKSCHLDNLEGRKPTRNCSGCHSGKDVHAGRHGESCGDCHTTADWTRVQFDHQASSGFPLTGKHRDLSCLQCHRGSLDEKLGSECLSCHRADDVHRSKDMRGCDDCHQSTSWASAKHFDHELTRFPLEGMHAIATCDSCHTSLEFHQATTACADCHGPDDIHESALGDDCAGCHTPNGWALWRFDHDTATDFPLAGAHAGLSCDSCHQGSNARDVPHACAGCHAGDDRHRGGFGSDCGRCHSADSFGDLQWHK